MKLTTRVLALLMAVLLCILPVHAAEPEDEAQYFTEWSEGLDAIMAEYIATNGLSERNFAMGYLYTGTGEYWYYNEDKMMVGGSIYKLPLNMRITEMVAAGERSWNDYVGGMPLAEAQRMSVTHSNNDISIALQHYCAGFRWGYYTTYRAELLKYSGWSEDEIPVGYYGSNTFSAEYMLNTLAILHQNSDFYNNIIGYMKDASPGLYFRRNQGEYEIAHKYGMLDNIIHDVGIVYTPTPFLLVVMTQDVYGERILGELCQLMTEYTLNLDAKYEAERQAGIDKAEAIALALAAEEAAEAEAVYSAAQLSALTEQTEADAAALADALALATLQLCLP